ncbi:hypothetical protein D3C87_1724840 [compost metagenome]
MPGADGKVGQVTFNMLGDTRQCVKGRVARIDMGFEPFAVLNFEGQQRFGIRTVQLAHSEWLH